METFTAGDRAARAIDGDDHGGDSLVFGEAVDRLRQYPILGDDTADGHAGDMLPAGHGDPRPRHGGDGGHDRDDGDYPPKIQAALETPPVDQKISFEQFCPRKSPPPRAGKGGLA